MKRSLVLIILFLAGYSSIKAQGDIGQLIKGSTQDANYLVKGYVTPALNTIGFGLNQSWYNTAKTHKLIGFDLTMTVSGISIPTSDFTYRVENSQLQNLTVIPAAATGIDAPTIFGSSTAPKYQPTVLVAGNKIPSGLIIDGARGLDLKKEGVSFIPIPMVQLGIGLPKGTDLKLRFFPSTKLGSDGSVSLFGIGVMHDVKQYIPGMKNLPFDLSAFVGYTTLKFDVNLDSSKPDQKANFSTSATTIQGLISKKFSVLTLYGGLGYNFISSDLAVKGTYQLDNFGNSIKDPISISNSQSGPRITAGLRLKFAIFTLHGDYTLQKYSAFTVGFGFAVR